MLSGQTVVSFINFRKAFDSVDREALDGSWGNMRSKPNGKHNQRDLNKHDFEGEIHGRTVSIVWYQDSRETGRQTTIATIQLRPRKGCKNLELRNRKSRDPSRPVKTNTREGLKSTAWPSRMILWYSQKPKGSGHTGQPPKKDRRQEWSSGPRKKRPNSWRMTNMDPNSLTQTDWEGKEFQAPRWDHTRKRTKKSCGGW